MGQCGAVLVGTWWYLVSRRWYWLIFGGAGSEWGGSGWYLVVLGQYTLVLLGIKWYWASIRLLCLYLSKKGKFGRMANKQGKIELLSQ